MAPLAHSLVLLSCTGSFAYHARPVLVQPHRATRTLPTVASAAPTPFESRETLANGEARTDGSSEDHTNLHHYPSGIGEAGAVPDPRDEHLQSHMVDVVHEGAGARWQPQANADEVSSEEASGVGSRTEGTLLMLAVAMLWGSNFPAVKATLEAGLPGSAAAALRFSVAALALLPLLKPPEGEKELPRELVLGGLECGCWLALGYIAQSLALHDLPAGTVAFLASLQVVFVPVLLTLMGGKFTPRLALAAAMCIGGVGLLESEGTLMAVAEDVGATTNPSVATFLALLQPVGFGTSYLRIESLMKRYPEYGLQVSSLQLLSNAAIAVVWTAINALVLARATTPGFYDLSALHEPSVVAGVLYTGLISTALTVLLQTRALSMLPATDSSVIVATEPLWAAGFATILLGEVLDTNAQIGGAMILAGCLSNVLLPEDIGMPATEPSPEQEA